MKGKIRLIGKRALPAWLLVVILVVSGAGAAAGTVLAGKVTGEVPVAVSQALLVGEPTAVNYLTQFETSGTGGASWSTEEAYSGGISVKMETGASPVDATPDRARIIIPGYGKTLSEITSLSYWTKVTEALSDPTGRMRPWIGFYLDGDGDLSTWEYYIQTEPMYAWPNGAFPYTIPSDWELWDAYDATHPLKWLAYEVSPYFESPDLPYEAPTLDDYITGGAVNFMTSGHGLQQFATREYGTLTVQKMKIEVGYGSPWPDFTGYVDDLSITGIDAVDLTGIGNVPQGTQRLFHSPNRYIGAVADDNTAFQFASEIAVGDLYLIALPLKNASENELVAMLTMDVPDCLEVEVMSADQVHGAGNVTEAVRINCNQWKITVLPDAEYNSPIDNLYIAVQADDYCAPGYYTINGIIKQIPY